MYNLDEKEEKYLKEIGANIDKFEKEEDDDEFDKLVDYICGCETSNNFDDKIFKTEKYKVLCNLYERIINR